MQAIVTKYLGATNHKPSRIKASCDAGSVTLSWDHALDTGENHNEAMRALVAKFGWQNHGTWFQGSLPQNNKDCFVYVCNPRTYSTHVNVKAGE